MPANTGSKVTGKIGSMLPPGREVDGKLIRRSVLWLNLSGIGLVADPRTRKLAYLLLQWLGSAASMPG